jgi:hypothetical protein
MPVLNLCRNYLYITRHLYCNYILLVIYTVTIRIKHYMHVISIIADLNLIIVVPCDLALTKLILVVDVE